MIQGATVTQEQSAACGTQAAVLSNENQAVAVKVFQSKEPPHFMLLWDLLVVNSSTHQSSQPVALWHVRGSNAQNTHGVEVTPVPGSLNSGDAFVLRKENELFIWRGTGCTGAELAQAQRLVARIGTEGEAVHEIEEGEETPETDMVRFPFSHESVWLVYCE